MFMLSSQESHQTSPFVHQPAKLAGRMMKLLRSHIACLSSLAKIFYDTHCYLYREVYSYIPPENLNGA